MTINWKSKSTWGIAIAGLLAIVDLLPWSRSLLIFTPRAALLLSVLSLPSLVFWIQLDKLRKFPPLLVAFALVYPLFVTALLNLWLNYVDHQSPPSALHNAAVIEVFPPAAQYLFQLILFIPGTVALWQIDVKPRAILIPITLGYLGGVFIVCSVVGLLMCSGRCLL